MSVNWKLMIQLRERQRTEASDRVAKERSIVAESEAQVAVAKNRLQQEHDAKAALWERTNSAFREGACRIEQLQFAMSYSRSLDRKATEAMKAVQQAQVEMQKKVEVLDQRRQELREAMGDLEKAREMQSRHVKNMTKKSEARQEDAVDEWSSSTWLSHSWIKA